MLYQSLAELVETHKLDIARKMAQTAFDRHFVSYAAYPSLDVEQLAQRLLPTVEMACHYLYNGDSTQYRNHVYQITLDRLKAGYSGQNLYDYSAILTLAVSQVVEQELVGEEDQSNQQRYLRRLQGLQTLAQTTILSAQATFKNTQKTKL